MRRCTCGVAARAVAMLAMWSACALAFAREGGVEAGGGGPEEEVVVVCGVSFASGCGAGGAALGEVARGALAARGVRAVVAAAPAACSAPDEHACLDAVLAALARGSLTAALVPAARAPPPPRLRDAGLEELGDAAPPAHRACYATPPAAPSAAPRSLLDFVDADLASLYSYSKADLQLAFSSLSADHDYKLEYETGSEPAASYATVLVRDAAEADVLRAVIAAHGLRARTVVVPGAALAALAPRPAVVCGRALDPGPLAALGARALAPPPCLVDRCPFEARRLIKLVNVRALARSPSALRVLAHLALDERELRTLEERAHAVGAPAAAEAVVRAHGAWASAAGEVRVAVMVPATTRREAWDARALRAAAELAERDEAEEATDAREFEFKAALLDGACSGPRAFKHLTDALGAEFGALSALAGPACGGAFGDVTRQSGALALPVLAYTGQAPPTGGAAARLTLLAGGDARREPATLAALLALLGWRRLAVLSELATRPALDLARLGAHVLTHIELPGDGERVDAPLVREWAARAAHAHARVLYVCVEDARAARTALCAGRRAGLVPRAGAVWLVGGALPAGWLEPRAEDEHGCSRVDLAEVAEGHLTVTPAWAGEWVAPASWTARWRAQCARAAPGDCTAPSAHAALLYDVLRLWAATLARLLRADPPALDDLHRHDRVTWLVSEAARTRYVGVTGAFEWEAAGEDGARARAGALLVRQWRNGSAHDVGAWRAGELTMRAGALHWQTADGRAPDDGAERCALHALASALGIECGAAYAAAGALPSAAIAALLAGGAWRWRQRARQERRARLRALGMRALALCAGAPDRWEVPRERVVINRRLGAGAFGTVYGGHALLRDAPGEAWTAVAVKTLKAGAGPEEKLDFLAEAEAMKRLEHENVVRLLGVVTASEPVCTIMEFVLYGDLKGYLVARRHLAHSGEVTPARLTRMARDAARALAYLARQRVVHRDVAARNCLVTAQRRLKLADFGMARLVSERDYYRFGRRGMLPVRWMAPESLARGVFSPASDVWALGVLLYEIITFGALPFQGLSNAQVVERVKAGRVLDLPAGLKPQLEGLIRSCWQHAWRARPSAAAIGSLLGETPRLLVPCLDLPLDALPLALEPAAVQHSHQARWVSWAAPLSAATDCTYLSAEGAAISPVLRDTDDFLPQTPPAPHDTDVFLPHTPCDTDAFLPQTPPVPNETDVFLPHTSCDTDAFLPQTPPVPNETDVFLPHTPCDTDAFLPQTPPVPHNTDMFLPHTPCDTDDFLPHTSPVPRDTDAFLPHTSCDTDAFLPHTPPVPRDSNAFLPSMPSPAPSRQDREGT